MGRQAIIPKLEGADRLLPPPPLPRERETEMDG